MIWFGNLNPLVPAPPVAPAPTAEHARMQQALEHVAEHAPHLSGSELVEALADTGWVEPASALRLLPHFRHFDPDRHFAEHLRRLSFRGGAAADDFRQGVRRVVEDLTGNGRVEEVGPEVGIRFESGEHQGVVLAHPEVSFTISGRTREAVLAAVEEMPDSLVVVARNFERGTAEQLASLLSRTGVPGTLITLNLLLGMRAIALRYQPPVQRVVHLLGAGQPLRSADIALLGDRN